MRISHGDYARLSGMLVACQLVDLDAGYAIMVDAIIADLESRLTERAEQLGIDYPELMERAHAQAQAQAEANARTRVDRGL